jgi:ubiquinone/menaquinone biosynthesis C-methylase UbiE
VADALFEDPRLASIYDLLDDPRDDLDAYLALVEASGARSVLDIGCGTGTFACLLAARGIEVAAVDPAAASVAVARRKPHANAVRWLLGDASALPELRVDVVTMTGNVAQVFVTDEDWATALRGAHRALRPGRILVFEVRDPDREAWREWTREQTCRSAEIPGLGTVETWVDVTRVQMPLISFRTTFVFSADGAVLTSESTLRFRTRAEIARSLRRSGFVVDDVRDAPDRPGREFVFVARRPETASGD